MRTPACYEEGGNVDHAAAAREMREQAAAGLLRLVPIEDVLGAVELAQHVDEGLEPEPTAGLELARPRAVLLADYQWRRAEGID